MTPFRRFRAPLAALLVLAAPAAAWAQGTGNGLYGEYYNSGNWTGALFETRLNEGPNALVKVPPTQTNPVFAAGDEPAIDFYYSTNLQFSPNENDDGSSGTASGNGNGGPRGLFGTNGDNFSTIWRGELEAPVTGNYRFQVRSDDLAQFYFNGVRILAPNVTTSTSGYYALTAGVRYPVVLMHQEYGGGAYIHLRWERPDQVALGFPPIPRRWFYSPTVVSTVLPPTFSNSPGGQLAPQTVTLSTLTPGATILYTIDGSDPGIVLGSNPGALTYTVPFTIDQYGIVRARAYLNGLVSSLMVSPVYSKNFAAVPTPVGVVAGVYYRYYDLPALNALPVFTNLIPQARGIMPNFSITLPPAETRPRLDQLGFIHSGYINIPTAGDWRFWTRSDDGSRLYIDGQEVVNNDGLHGLNFPTAQGMPGGPITLEAGYHTIEVRMFENGGGEGLEVYFQGPPASAFPVYGPIPNTLLFTDPMPATPTISPNGGQFAGTRVVTLTCATPGAILYWTTDGTTPNPFSPVYHHGSGPTGSTLTITRDTVLRVMATAPFRNPSSIAQAVFFNSPLLLSARAASVTSTELLVAFDKAVETTTATNPANYVLNNGATVSAASLVTKPGLLKAHWKLDELADADNALDFTLNNNFGVTLNPLGVIVQTGAGNVAPLLAANPASRSWFFFDDQFTVADSPSLDLGATSFTIAFWMRPFDSTNALRIINKWDPALNRGWQLDWNRANGNASNNSGDGVLRFYMRDALGNAVDARIFVDPKSNQWMHLAVRVDFHLGRIVVFRNGILRSTVDMTSNMRAADNDASLMIGNLRPQIDTIGAFVGNLDDIRIYGSGLTDGEILGLASGGDAVTTMVRLTTSALSGNYDLTVAGVRAVGNGTLPMPSQVASFTVQAAGTILQESYTGFGGGTVPDLTRNVRFPANSVIDSRTLYETITKGDNYGARVRGYFVPPSGGNWKFAIATDDYGQFWISPNEDPANKVLVSRVMGWTPVRRYIQPNPLPIPVDPFVNGSTFQSVPIPLVAGQKYYVEALMKEGGGGDNLAVAAKPDDGTAIANATAPIAGALLVQMRDPVIILRQPYSRVTGLGVSVTFDVVLTGTGPVTYVWRKNGVPIAPAATGRTYDIVSTVAADAGLYSVQITAGSQVLTSTDASLVVHDAAGPPTFAAINPIIPTGGSTAGGNLVTITGTNFMNNATGVAFGGNPATGITFINSTQITALVPAGSLGPISVLVSTPLGYATLPNAYTYVIPPTISQVNANFGLTAGGNTVTITGTNFLAGFTVVNFGANPGTFVNVTSDTPTTDTLTVQVPNGVVPGAVDVVVIVQGINSAALVGGYTYFDLPTVTGLSPSAGNTGGGNDITVTGTGFAPTSTVTFDFVPSALVTFVNSTTLTVRVPPGVALQAAVVRATNPAGTSTVNQVYTYYATPTLATVTANQGADQGGLNVALSGTGFVTGQTSVSFGGTTVPAGSVNVSAVNALTVNTPLGSPGSVNVTVTTPGGTSVQTVTFTYYLDPTVSLIDPVVGPSTGGTLVTITGANFVPGSTTVLFGINPGTIQTEAGAGTSLTVLSPGGTPGPAVAVTVTTPGGSAVTAGAFTYFAAPDAVSINPTAGATVGGTPFTITGTTLGGATSVTFDGLAATGITSTATTINGFTPPHAVGAVNVVITTPGGSDTLVAGYSYVVAPTVTGVSPSAGITTGGNTVTVTGSGFIGATSVTFGGVAGTNLSVTNATTLVVDVPLGAGPGPVNVVVTVGGLTGTLVNGYTYWNAPTLATLLPTGGNISGGNTVTLTGTNFAAGITVSFGGTPGTNVSVTNGTTLTVRAPLHAAGLAPVSVTTPGGTSGTVPYTYYATPTLATLSSVTGFDQGGQTLTLTGSNFATGVTTVTIGATTIPAGSVNVIDPATLSFVTPAGTGLVNVTVATPAGTTAPLTFTYYADPTLTVVNPAAGPLTVGNVVTLTGTNFVVGNTAVTFGGAPGTSVSVSNATTLTVAVPAGGAGAVAVVVTTPGGVANLAAGYTYHAPPTITGILPVNGPTNGGTAFTITGTNFVNGSTSVTFGGVSAPLTGVAAGTIDGTTPQRPAGAVVVRVTTPGGFVDTAYTYDNGPFVSAINPNAGSTGGGETVTITGTGLTGVTGVTFGGAAGTALNVIGATSLTVVTPARPAGAADVVVTSPAGSFTVTGGFTYVTTPTIAGITPAVGPNAGGNTVVITGSSFLAGGTTVTFGSTNASGVVVSSPTSLSAVVPAGTGAVAVTVATSLGTSPPSTYTYYAVPTLANIAPTSGFDQGGQTVTFTGTNFAAGVTTVAFGPVTILAGAVTVSGPTSLTVASPAGSGTVNVTVSTPGGTTAAQAFTYRADPTITLVSPADGPLAAGTVVTITGTNFLTGATGVTFGGVTGTAINVLSATSLTVAAPAGSAGAVAVAVTTAGGTAVLGGGYTYHAAPSITTINPLNGPTDGGTPFTITGANFPVGKTTVTFGGASATSIVAAGATVGGNTPQRPAGAATVVVTTPGGSVNTSYTYNAGPFIATIAPNAGPTAGATVVTITGSGFSAGTTSVTFGGIPGTAVAVTGTTSLTVSAPAHGAGAVDVVVTTPVASFTAAGGYTYVTSPTITSITPSNGPNAGGNTVTITGTSFLAGATNVFFGAAPSGTVVVSSPTSLTAVVPGGSNTVNVTVSTAAGTSPPVPYTYFGIPTLSVVAANTGFDQGGQTVTLTGTNFAAGLTTVDFGGNPGTAVNVTGTTSLTVVTPAGAGAVGVTVTTPGGTTGPQTFTYRADPTITLIAPTDGPLAAGTIVTITGTNFLATATGVTFGGVAGTAVNVTGTTSLTVAAPAHAAGTVDVVVTTAGGSAVQGGGYTYHAAPTISGISPGTGSTDGGTPFTITGANLPAGKTTVTFGGAAATSIVASGAAVSGNTPQRPAGVAVVTVTTPGGSAATSFTYNAGPFITSVSPSAGSTIGGNTVTLGGSGFTGVTSVAFGGTPGTGLVVTNDTTLSIVAPAHVAGTVGVTVSTPTASFTLAGGYTYVTTPTITSIVPADGPTAGGNTVTINGTSFLAGGTTVRFNGAVVGGLVVLSPTSLTVTVPGGAGTVPVTVQTAIGTSPPSSYTYHAPPTLTLVNPNSGLDQGGQTITLTGTNFAAGLTSVTMGGTTIPAGSVTVGPTTSLTFISPAGSGVVNISVTTPGGTTGTLPFTYFADPTITLVSPANGPTAGGTLVTITGTNFVAGSTTVQFGAGAPIPAAVGGGGTSLTVTAPNNGAPGAVAVRVVAPGGAITLPGGYTYHDPPTITNINPVQGPLVAGTAFTITGTNLPAGSTTVTFAGAVATGVSATVTQVVGSAPAGAAGAAVVRVTTPGGFVDTTYTYVAAPVVSTITPNRGSSAGGQTVVITGANFVAGTEVRFGGVSAAVGLITATTLTCTTPPHAAGLVDVAVTTFNPPGQTTTRTNFYTYVDAATSVDLSMLINVDDAVPNVGQDVVLTATLSNGGALAATGVSVNVAIPAGLSVLSAIPSAGTYAAGVWSVGNVATASSVTLTITATVTSSATLVVSAEVAAATPQDTDSIPGNGSTTEDDRATVTVDADLAITTSSPLPGATSNAFYSQPLAAEGGATPYTWSLVSSTPAFPFALNPATGVISGTAPVVAGTTGYTFTIGVADSTGDAASKTFTMTISPSVPGPATVNALPAPPSGTVGIPYGFTFTAINATPPYTWSTTGAPAGLSLNPFTGTLAGTPTAAATTNFTVTATPAAGTADSQAFSITIDPNPLAFVTDPALPPGAVGSAYQQTLEIQGGIGGFTWSSGALPGGLTLTGTGRTASLAGNPGAAGSFTFSVTVTDNNAGQLGENVVRTFLIDILPAGSTFTVNSATLPPATQGIAYTATLTSAGGAGAVTWALAGGALPAGLTLAPATGVISGTPTVSGVFGITVRGTDSLAATDTADLVIDVAAAPLITTPTPLPNALLNAGYFTQLAASGGTPPLAWTVGAGLPAGVTLSGVSGALSGSPTAAGAFNFTVTATDARGAVDTQVYDLTVQNPGATLAIVGTLPPGVAGVPYNGSMLAANVTPPFTWSVTLGVLPAWATLNPATGAVTGIPTAGTTLLTFQADDAVAGVVSSGAFNLVIAAGLAVTTTSLPGADPGFAYSATLTSSGGTAPVSWSLISGSLPGGYSMTPAGVISGNTASTGLYTIQVQVTDVLGATASRLLTLLVAPGAGLVNSGSSGKQCSLSGTAAADGLSPAWALLLLLAAFAVRKRE